MGNELTLVLIHQLVSNPILPDGLVVASFKEVLVEFLVPSLWESDTRD
jgi:hypothetical protein